MDRTRGIAAAAAFLAALALVPSPAGSAALSESVQDALLQKKCSLCHTSKRIYTMDPDQLRAIVERMRKMNPDWLSTEESGHVVDVLTKVLGDPNVVAARTAWQEAVERGRALFEDQKLGRNGKACTDCHTVQTMQKVADGFPRYDLRLRRLLTLEDMVELMVRERLEGQIDPNGAPMLDLLAYLKSL